MNLAIPPAEIRQHISGHLESVFATMLSLQAKPCATVAASGFAGNRVTGSVSLVGEKVNGQVYLHLETFFAIHATAAMLGMSVQEIGSDAEINDVLGEITNMIAGGLKSWLCDAGAACTLTTPAIIRGSSYQIIPRPGVEIILAPFECATRYGLAELHLKFT